MVIAGALYPSKSGLMKSGLVNKHIVKHIVKPSQSGLMQRLKETINIWTVEAGLAFCFTVFSTRSLSLTLTRGCVQ